jgi:hypothetical protein
MSNNNKQRGSQMPPKEYFMICCEWWEVPEESALVTMPQSVSDLGRNIPKKIVRNEVIDVHPVLYTIDMQGHRRDFVITDTLQITRRLYEYVINLNAQHAAEVEEAKRKADEQEAERAN